MGERLSFPSNGEPGQGYFAAPDSARGPAVVVIQEWWGLVPHIEDLVDRFAREGFCAIAPDLYHGVTTTSPDAAGKMLMELDVERAEREIAAAGEFLLQRPECSSQKFAIIGFCMGGALAQYAATKNASRVAAVASFYGGFKKVAPDWDQLDAPILLIYGADDQGVPAEQGRELHRKLTELGKRAEIVVYPGAGHAFFNDSRPAVYNPEAAADAWAKTIDLFRAELEK